MNAVAPSEILVHADKSAIAVLGVDSSGAFQKGLRSARALQSYLVKDAAPSKTVSITRTTQPHGLSREEVRRIVDGFYGLRDLAREHHRRGARVVGVDIAPGTPGDEINSFRRRLTNLQREARIPQAWLSVEETDGGVHKHFLALANDEVVERLEKSQRFQATAVGTPRFATKNAHASAAAYLAKEATPQAAYKNPAVPHRKRGSHRLPHGGDRVRVSKALGPYVEPWPRTNAKRAETRKPYRKRQLARSKAPRPADQVVLPFEDGRVHRPVARLHDFGGGLMPTSVAREIEFQRRQAGLSQRDLAQRCGIGQPQLANALRGHDPVSSWVVARLRDALLEQAA